MRGTPDEIAKRWATRTTAAVPDAVAGARRVREAPGAAAARQKTAYLANVQAKADKWERNVAKVTKESWLASFEAGANRIAQGVQGKQGKMMTHMQNAASHYEAIQSELAQRPRGNLEQNLTRMLWNARRMAEYKSPS